MDFSQPVAVNIPYDYVPPVQGPRSYARPVVTINKGEAQAIGNWSGPADRIAPPL